MSIHSARKFMLRSTLQVSLKFAVRVAELQMLTKFGEHVQERGVQLTVICKNSGIGKGGL